MAKKALQLNDDRADKAESYMRTVPILSDAHYLHSQDPPPTLSIGIITTNRENSDVWRLHYLTQTAAAIHKEIRRDDLFDRKVLFICNVDPHPDTYNESKRIQHLVESVNRFSGKETTKTSASELFEKEKNDYIFCLEHAVNYDPEYVILLQDDAVVMDGFLNVLYNNLHHRITNDRVGRKDGHNSKSWTSLKLYHPEKWQGFSFSLKTLIELCGFSMLVGWSFVMFGSIFHSINRPYSRSRWQIQLFFIGVIYALTLAICIGRPAILSIMAQHPQLYKVVSDPGCCIPAVMYNRAYIQGLIDFLRKTRCHIDFPVDLAIDKYFFMTGNSSYLLEPNIVTHVGMLSSLRPGLKVASEFL